jgi:hypothetical protein
MTDLQILVWKNKEASGEPETVVTIPVSLAKWLPKMMRFVPTKTKEETWGREVDFEALVSDLEKIVEEAQSSGRNELMDVRTTDSHVKILVSR